MTECLPSTSQASTFASELKTQVKTNGNYNKEEDTELDPSRTRFGWVTLPCKETCPAEELAER